MLTDRSASSFGFGPLIQTHRRFLTIFFREKERSTLPALRPIHDESLMHFLHTFDTPLLDDGKLARIPTCCRCFPNVVVFSRRGCECNRESQLQDHSDSLRTRECVCCGLPLSLSFSYLLDRTAYIRAVFRHLYSLRLLLTAPTHR